MPCKGRPEGRGNIATLTFFSYLLVAVHRDAEQPGEIHQAAVAHYVGDVSTAKRGRDAEEEQDEDGVPDDAADL